MSRPGIPLEPGSDEDRAERACPLGWSCPCPHTGCRAGWLDEDRRVTHRGRVYVQNGRCPACWSAWQRHLRANGREIGSHTNERTRPMAGRPGGFD